MGIGAVVALYIFVVLVEWIIVKCTGITLSLSYTKDFGLTFVVISILFFLDLVASRTHDASSVYAIHNHYGRTCTIRV